MKLKEIPENTVVHTPTEEEARELLAILRENGYKWKTGHDLVEASHWTNEDTCYHIYTERKAVTWDFVFECDGKVIFFSEFKERYCEVEKPQPKFKVDDIVAIRWINKWGRITNVHFSEEAEEWEYNIKVYPKGLGIALESNLTPYTEPEAKPTAKETKESEEIFASEELNLCELLQGHEGETFYSPFYGAMVLMSISDGLLCFQNSNIGIDLLTNGQSEYAVDGYCAIFPSKALYEQYPLDPYTAWMKWQEEQTIYHIRIEFQPYDERGEMKCGNMGTLHFNDLKFRTPSDRDQCIEEINAIIEKYSKK